MHKKIVKSLRPEAVSDGDGVRLNRIIGGRELDYLDPFLLLDHFGSENPDDYINGFPMHPHRGIETVTYMLAGRISHRDSVGNEGAIESGDVQWMTAGSGIMHEEMPELVDQESRMDSNYGSTCLQRRKMTSPKYQEFKSNEIPSYDTDFGSVKLICGEFEGNKGPVEGTSVDPVYMDVTLRREETFRYGVGPGRNAAVYLFEGGFEAWLWRKGFSALSARVF